MYETLRCEFCNYQFERIAQRGRKPRLCEYCRMEGIKLQPKRGQVKAGVLELTDGGRTSEGYKFETNDCTVRAMAVATNSPYARAHSFMKEHGRKDRKGVVFAHVLIRSGYTAFGYKFTPIRIESAKGLRMALDRNPMLRYGTYILHMTRHVAVLRDGKLVDSFDSSRKVIDRAYLVTPEVEPVQTPTVKGVQSMTITCRQCGVEFPKPTTRGRPPVKCVECRAAAPTNPAKSSPVEVAPIPLKGKEAQCPLCDRRFTSDSACEAHKPYRTKSKHCADPLTIGMVEVNRRGFTFYTRPDPRYINL